MWTELLVYGILLILVYFAVGGVFAFEVGARNSAFGAATAGVSSGDSSALLKERIVYGFLVVLTFPLLSTIGLIVKRHAGLFAIVAVAALSSIWSQDPRTSFSASLRLLLDVLFVVYLFRHYSSQQVMRLFVMLGWIVSIASLLFVLVVPRFGIDQQDAHQAWQGIFSHKNFCGYELVFLLTPVFFLESRSTTDRIQRIAYFFFLSFIIVMSQSRTSWTALFALLVFVGIFNAIRRFQYRDSMFLACCICLAFVAVGLTAFSVLPSLFALIGKDITLTGRTEIWGPVVASIMKRPLTGYGYCAFWNGLSGESGIVASTVGWVPPHAHNGFLNVALQVGITGLLVLMAGWFFGIRNAILSLQSGAQQESGWYLTVFFVTLVVNVTEPTLLFYNYLAWLMYLVACVGAKLTAGSRGSKEGLT
jgi:exopolysaccharide production protein ExoQ